MTYRFNEEVIIGDKTFAKDTEIEITVEQIAELSDEAREAFNGAINDGRITEVVPPVEPDVQEPEVNDPKEPASVQEETASASPAVEPSVPAPAESAKTSGQVEPPKSTDSGWVGGHTIGQENVRPGGSLTTRDPNLSVKR